MLLEAGLCGAKNRQRLVCTQPRRVAAITLAKRVAAERGCAVGSQVGYAVRFDECCGGGTPVRYVTDGVLLREAMVDPLLKRYGNSGVTACATLNCKAGRNAMRPA